MAVKGSLRAGRFSGEGNMGLQLENETNVSFDFDMEEIAKQVIETTLTLVHCLYEVEVSLLLTNDEIIKKLNYQYRGINQPTDVLSFPTNDPARISEIFSWQYHSGEMEDEHHLLSSFHPESGELILGDIVISADSLIKQAGEYGHSIKREYAFLIVHSVLHLLGFDHIEEEERILMEETQDEVLDKVGITR